MNNLNLNFMKVYLIVILCFSNFFISAQTEVPVDINDGGYIFLKVKINSRDTAIFMLDTGSGITVFSSRLFNKYNLKQAGLHTGTRHNGELITGMLYILPSLSIGNFTKQNVVIGSYDALQNCDGLLSMDFFRDTPFTIDFINRKLIIETPQTLSVISKQAEKIPIELKSNGKNELDFFVSICMNDSIKADAEFDTGSGFNMLMLNTKYLDKLDINLHQQPNQDYGYYVYSTTLPLLKYCNSIKLQQKNVFVGFKEGLIYEALIGSGMFRNKKLSINIPASEIMVRE
jgi:hypothetical protein